MRNDGSHHSLLRQAKVRFRKFQNGEFCLEDQTRSERPVVVNEERLLELVREDPRRARGGTRENTPELNTCVALEGHIGMVHGYRMNLAATSWQERQDACMNFLTLRRNFFFCLENLVTDDEKWVVYVNHIRKR